MKLYVSIDPSETPVAHAVDIFLSLSLSRTILLTSLNQPYSFTQRRSKPPVPSATATKPPSEFFTPFLIHYRPSLLSGRRHRSLSCSGYGEITEDATELVKNAKENDSAVEGSVGGATGGQSSYLLSLCAEIDSEHCGIW